jgi:starch synthase (maltosyl-transferring)
LYGGGGKILMNRDRRLTVLHFANEPVRGGAEEHLLMLVSQLDRARFRPMVAASPELIELLRSDLPVDVETFAITLRSPRDLSAAWRFRQFLAAQKVDIVHSHMFQASKFASPLGWLTGVPVRIETPHVREDWRRGWLKGTYFVDRFVGRFVTAFIAVSVANGEYLKSEKRLPAAKICVIQNGSPLERFDPQRTQASELRHSLAVEEHTPVIIVLARLEPQKGHRVLLDAWKRVAALFPAARLVLVGEGSLRAELEAQAAALGIAHCVRFAGYQSNVPEWLALAEFTVLPSFFEGLPLAAIESLAAARAVVATAVDGSTEAVLHNETGLTVPPGEPAPLAAAICQLLAAPHLARKLGQAGRRFAEERFSQQRQVAETEALYIRAWQNRVGGRLASMLFAPTIAQENVGLARNSE